jgi:hypothetical protein
MPEPVTPMSEEAATKEAHRLIAEAYTPTSYRDDSLPATSTIGPTPPVPQPGRPPMSQKATDASALMVTGGFATLCLGAAVSAVLHYSGQADPVVVGCICGAPPAVLLALSRLVKRAKGALPDEHHHHYDGPVYQDQRNVQSKTTGLIAKTNNQ